MLCTEFKGNEHWHDFTGSMKEKGLTKQNFVSNKYFDKK
jgi:hypothetical protein